MTTEKKPYDRAEYMRVYLKAWRDKNRQRVRDTNQRAYRKRQANGKALATRRKYLSVPANYEKMRIRNRATQLKTYGLTPEQFDAMVAKQAGVCAICRQEQTRRRWANKRLAVDHDHKCCPGNGSCGKCVRGLLCDRCNQGIGSFEDDIELLRLAIQYLSDTSH